ncbi:unnamed protein product [Calicophoron daubneyi]|uniref:Exonuclease domain-containing protein n=1 Tax=Calicophoron daubneyi TaxID=300641 RepID=A0AAV2T4S8_CALDB
MVDNQPYLKDVLQLFDEFMQTEKLGTEDNSFAFVTCGDWDLRKMLPSQCKLLEIDVPTYFRKWINIKKVHADVVGRFPSGMLQMLSDLDLPHQGRHHSGIDDCKNIAEILRELIRRGAVPDITGSI